MATLITVTARLQSAVGLDASGVQWQKAMTYFGGEAIFGLASSLFPSSLLHEATHGFHFQDVQNKDLVSVGIWLL